MQRRGSLLLSVAVSALALLLQPGDASAFDHVQNGGFEDGLDGWRIGPGATFDVVDTAAEGSRSLRVVVDSGRFRIQQDLPAAIPPGVYVLSATVRAEAIGTRISIQLALDSEPWNEPEATLVTIDTAWAAIEADARTGTASYARLTVEGDAPPGSIVFVDAVRLDGPPPTTVTATPTQTSTSLPGAAATTTALAAAPSPSATATPTLAADTIAWSLRNSGFEDAGADGAPAAWEAYGGSARLTAPGRSGAQAAEFQSATGSTKWLHQSVLVDAGAWYDFSAWVVHDDNGVAAAWLRISWYSSADASGTAITTSDSTTVLNAPSPGWRHLATGSVLAPAGARSARLRIMLAPASAAPAAIRVDDASFAPTDAPAAPLPTPPTPDAPAPPLPVARSGDASGPARSTARTRTTSSAVSETGAPIGSVTGVVLISEVLYDPDSPGEDAASEWVELFNPGDSAIDLAGWTLADNRSVDTLTSLVVPARGFAIVAASDAFRSAYPAYTGPLALVGRIGNGLGNDGDRLTLARPDGTPSDALSWGEDASAFDPAVADVPAGHSIERRAPDHDTNAAADFVDNDAPSPGRPLPAEVISASRAQAGDGPVPILERAAGGRLAWLPWAAFAASLAALAGVVTWRAVDALRGRMHRA